MSRSTRDEYLETMRCRYRRYTGKPAKTKLLDEFRRGPYYKHQCWEGGRNRSCRVPAEQVGQVREDLANGRRFEEITGELADIAVAEGRSRRDSRKAGHEAGDDAKKTPRAVPRGALPRNRSLPRDHPGATREGRRLPGDPSP